jgi:hypothetical protein
MTMKTQVTMNYGTKWDKVSLKTLCIILNNEEDDNNEGDEPAPDWEILARVLRYVNCDIKLDFRYEHVRGTDEMRAFTRAIQGHPAITSFDTSIGNSFHFVFTDILCSAWLHFQISKMFILSILQWTARTT